MERDYEQEEAELKVRLIAAKEADDRAKALGVYSRSNVVAVFKELNALWVLMTEEKLKSIEKDRKNA